MVRLRECRSTLIVIAVIRFIASLVWTTSILYGTYAVYVATTDFPTFREQVEQDGMGTGQWERDSSDTEWDRFTTTLRTKLGYWIILYILLSHLLSQSPVNVRMTMSVLITTGLAIHLMGWRSVLFLFKQMICYCVLMRKSRRRAVIWTFTILSLVIMNSDWIVSYYTSAQDDGSGEHWFYIVSAWNCARCLSYCFDNWNIPQPSLWHLTSYCFYFPTFLTGPIVLYSTFQRHILQNQGQRQSVKFLLRRLFHTGLMFVCCEAVIHVLHFRRLAWNYSTLRQLGPLPSAGIVFWLGQFFMLKYVVMYGLGTNLAEFEGMRMPPLPKCPAHIHRYSVLWKDFDRGLFDFLVRYTYVPTIQCLEEWRYTESLHPELRKFLGSAVTFAYIYLWHGLHRNVLVWTLLNFIGITVERCGTFIKKKISPRMEVDEMVWDLIVEPIVTVPLATMSILNSCVFLSDVDAAGILSHRILTNWRETWVIPVVFSLTHTAVALRTLPLFWPKLRDAWEESGREL